MPYGNSWCGAALPGEAGVRMIYTTTLPEHIVFSVKLIMAYVDSSETSISRFVLRKYEATNAMFFFYFNHNVIKV